MSQSQSTPLMLLHTPKEPVVSCATPAATESSSDRQRSVSTHLTAKDIISIVTLGLCLVLSILVVTPSVTFAWRLGSTNQIVIIGFLLGIMSICVRCISCTALLAMESCLGDSTLQNYDAILTDSIIVSHTSTYLRAILLFLLLLPLGLSIGYKQFLGGHTSSTLNVQIPNATYGIDYPSLGEYSMLNTATYLWLNAYSGFSAQVNPWVDTPLPNDLQNQAAPYGYNVLLLSNTSAAVLDLPSRSYMASIRDMMKPDETWYINASVNAFVSELNPSLDEVRKNDSFWKSSLQYTNPRMRYHGLTTVRRGGNWSDWGFGLIPEFQNNTGRGYGSSLLGMYPDKISDVVLYQQYSNYEHPVVSAFRRFALRFDVRRRRCSGRWEVSADTIRLLSGDCSTSTPATEVDSSVVEDYAPTAIDCLPNLFPTLNWLNASIQEDTAPVWKNPSYAVAVAISYWSRSANQVINRARLETYKDVEYAPIDEMVISSRSTLHANWLLYVILSIQPVLGLLGLLLVFVFRGTPNGDGFSTLGILGRLQPSSLSVVDDASLRGRINRPIWLQIQTMKRLPDEEERLDKTANEFQYVLSAEKPMKIR